MYTIETIEADPAEWPRREAAWASANLQLETERVLYETKTYPQAYEATTGSRNPSGLRGSARAKLKF
jgi:hypothetical protein